VVRETGATALLDGGNMTGMIAAYCASEATIHRAQVYGLAVVCLGDTRMTGRSAYNCEMIARAGLVVLHTVAAPFGGTRGRRSAPTPTARAGGIVFRRLTKASSHDDC
jgi:LDH2 family malate/lactate/ureidoglycolate dehydrogenase